MSEPTSSSLFTQLTEEDAELASDSDENETVRVLHTSPSRTQLNKHSKKIVKMCSPVFRVELPKKRGRPPKIK